MWIVSPLILSPNLTPLSDRPFQADNLLLSPELIKSCAGMLIILSLIFLKDGKVVDETLLERKNGKTEEALIEKMKSLGN